MNRRELLRSTTLAGAGLMLSHTTAAPAPRGRYDSDRLRQRPDPPLEGADAGTRRCGADGLRAFARLHGNAGRARPHAR